MKFFIYWDFFFFIKQIKENMATQQRREMGEMPIFFFHTVMKVFDVG